MIKSEEKYRALIECSPDAITIIDVNGNIKGWNKSAETITGYKAREVIGLPIIDLYPEWEKKKALKIWKTLQKKGVVKNIETQIMRKDKKIIDINLSVSLVRDSKGKVIGSVGISRDMTEIKKIKREKKGLEEEVSRFKRQIFLTEKEKLVLYGLTRYPNLTDQKIAKKFSLKRSTFTGIKNKLLREKFYKKFVIPNFQAIGAELLTFAYGNFNPTLSFEDRNKKGMPKVSLYIPEIIFVNSTDLEYALITISKNFTEFKKAEGILRGKYEEANVIKTLNYAHFPFEISQLYNFFDFSRLLRKTFSLADIKDEGSIEGRWKTPKKKTLRENEKKVLYGLVKYPELSDFEISKKLNLSKVTVHNIKNKLRSEGFLHEIIVPNIKKLGFSLLVSNHFRFGVDVRKKEVDTLIRSLKKEPSSILMVYGNRECILLCAFKEYSEYKQMSNKYAQIFEKTKVLVNAPSKLLISLQDRKFEKFEFSPLVKKILGIKYESL
jgi:PAS domain S-box-containing protein